MEAQPIKPGQREREKRKEVLTEDHEKIDRALETASTVCLAFMKFLDTV